MARMLERMMQVPMAERRQCRSFSYRGNEISGGNRNNLDDIVRMDDLGCSTMILNGATIAAYFAIKTQNGPMIVPMMIGMYE